ncbi:MAG: alr [Clostridiales bacterium]|nr:alr [Clostridiales bacterium]
MRPAWIEVDLNSLRKNIRNLKKLLSAETELIGVIKADGYGHGAVKIAEILRQEDVKFFAVAILEEGVELRENGFTERILILGYTPEEDYPKLIRYQLTPTIYNYGQAAELNKIAREMGAIAAIHVKVDTGMGRIGFLPGEDAFNEIIRISKLPNIFIEGIYSHLAVADQADNNFSRKQLTRFKKFTDELTQKGINIPIKHLANSAGIINFPEMHFNMVRAGISLYGIYPDPLMAVNPKVDLYPVMKVKAKLSHVKAVPPDTPISYGCTFKTTRGSIIGTVPMGYADGVFRLLSNQGEVLIRGERCPIAGRVCMDQFMVDLTSLARVQVGDEVVIIGAQGKERIGVDEVAGKVGTISYEVVSRMGKRLPRVYID